MIAQVLTIKEVADYPKVNDGAVYRVVAAEFFFDPLGWWFLAN